MGSLCPFPKFCCEPKSALKSSLFLNKFDTVSNLLFSDFVVQSFP